MYFVFKFYQRFYTIPINTENVVHIVVISVPVAQWRTCMSARCTYILKYFWVVYLNTYSLPRVFRGAPSHRHRRRVRGERGEREIISVARAASTPNYSLVDFATEGGGGHCDRVTASRHPLCVHCTDMLLSASTARMCAT